MIRDSKADQVKNAICSDNANLTLFSNQVKYKLLKCDLSSINCGGSTSGATSTASQGDCNGLFDSYHYNASLVCFILFISSVIKLNW